MKKEQLIETIQAALETGSSLRTFINRYSEIDTVQDESAGDDVSGVAMRLIQEAGMQSNPNFEICTVLNNELFIANESISLNDPAKVVIALLIAVDAAQANRTEFYEDREKDFGAGAWPTREERQEAAAKKAAV